jgi:hypothetical protein
VIVKNCLPCWIAIKIALEQDKDDANYVLMRGEEKQISQIRQTTSQIGISCELGEGFRSNLLKLFADKSAEVDMPIRVTDNYNREFTIQAKVDT